MNLIRLGIVNTNPKVGDFKNNLEQVLGYAKDAVERKCTLVVFPELTLSGYSPEDQVLWEQFHKAQWHYLNQFAKWTAETASDHHPTVFVLGTTVIDNSNVYNCTAVVCNGDIWGLVPKQKRPNSHFFHERRVYSAGYPGQLSEVNGVAFGDLLFSAPFGIFATTVCEDIWAPDGPMKYRAYRGAEVITCSSASPFRIGILDTRRELTRTRSSENQVVLAYTNQLGGNGSYVYDGGGFIVDNGRPLLETERWEWGLSVKDVDLTRTTQLRMEATTWREDQQHYLEANQAAPHPKLITIDNGPLGNEVEFKYPIQRNRSFFLPEHDSLIYTEPDPLDQLFVDITEALVLGLGDYFEKSGAFDRMGLGLSGGRDSALVAILAKIYADRTYDEDTHGKQKRKLLIADLVHCFSMPTKYNSPKTREAAKALAEELGFSFKELPITDEDIERELNMVRQMSDGKEPTPTTNQNIQARIRMTRLANWSNTNRALILAPGNQSEKAMGYSTWLADLQGGYGVIGNVPKTIIKDAYLIWLAERRGIKSIELILATDASAELAHDQNDEDDLMPFPVLDAMLKLFATDHLAPHEMETVISQMWSDDQLLKMDHRYEGAKTIKMWVDRFMKLFHQNLWKWIQSPQAPYMGSHDLDSERAIQLPVVQDYGWYFEDFDH